MIAYYDQWKGRAPEDDGPSEGPYVERVKPLTVCIACGGVYDVAGHSEKAERGEYVCTRCEYEAGEVAMGRMCAGCLKPKERDAVCCEDL